MTSSLPPKVDRRRVSLRLLAIVAALCAGFYLSLAYGLAPFVWRHFEHQRAIAGLSMTTVTAFGFSGDPLNVGLEGSRDDVICAMRAAAWSPADPVTLKSSLKIAGSVLLDRPYPQAPVSDLFYQGRREDLAFEKASGRSPDRRHHVRFWKVVDSGDNGRPIWLGAATYDRGVGISHYTGQITHHIGPDVDAERDLIGTDLAGAGKAEDVYETSGIGPILNGRNGGGDHYYTDGEILFTRLAEGCDAHVDKPNVLANPPAIHLKNGVWRWLKTLIGGDDQS